MLLLYTSTLARQGSECEISIVAVPTEIGAGIHFGAGSRSSVLAGGAGKGSFGTS